MRGRENTTIAAQTIMDAAALKQLIQRERIAALGTLRDGAPLVSMTLYLAADDFSAFHIHVSRLAWHTQDMLKDPRIALSIAEADDGRADPFTLMRVTLRGVAEQLSNDAPHFESLKAAWLRRFPQQAINFELADFGFWRLQPRDARFVAGYGRIANLSAADITAAAQA